jgi:hypothetical protein
VSDRSLPGIQPPAGKKKRSPLAWGVMIASLLILAVIIGFSVFGGSKSDYDSDTSYEAIAQCEAAIKERLKAPSTADFNSSAVGGGTWTVTGTVDAENSFGAKVRTNYQCSVIIDNEKDTARVRIDSFE